MPLTPAEQQEFDSLHAKYGQAPAAPAQGGLSPDEQAELAQLHQKFGGQAQSPAAPQSQHALSSFFNDSAYQQEADRFKAEHPNAPTGQGIASLMQGVAPPTAAGAAIGSKLASTFAGRVGTNAAIGAARGAINTPQDGESRLSNAGWGALKDGAIATGAEAVGGGLQLAGKASKWVGGKLAGLSPSEAESYAKDPALAEEMARMNREDPMGLSGRVRQEVKGGLDDAFNNVSKPTLEKLGQKLAGTQVRVNPSQFEGTAAGKELDRAWSTKGNTTTVVPPTTPTTQDVEVPPRAGYYSDASAAPNKLRVLLQEPPKEQAVPAPKPDSFWVSGPQALAAKRASSEAADHARALSPVGYNPSNDAEASAASNLGKALSEASGEGQTSGTIKGTSEVSPSSELDAAYRAKNPTVKDLNDTLSESARYARHARETMNNNPAAILTDSEGVGSVPTRSMRQFLDKNSGTKLESLAQALKAGRAATDPDRTHGIFDALVSKPTGRAALRASSHLPKSNEDAGSIAAILNALRSAK